MSSSLKRIGTKLMWHIKAFETPVFQRLELAQRALIKSTKAKRLQSFLYQNIVLLHMKTLIGGLLEKEKMPFGVPIIWCEQADRSTDCFFCPSNTKKFLKRRLIKN